MACARRRAYQRPMNKGCSTMITIKIQKKDEKSNDMARIGGHKSLSRYPPKPPTCRSLREEKNEMEDRSARFYTATTAAWAAVASLALESRAGFGGRSDGVGRCAHCRWGEEG